jgi:hypothetical protein
VRRDRDVVFKHGGHVFLSDCTQVSPRRTRVWWGARGRTSGKCPSA